MLSVGYSVSSVQKNRRGTICTGEKKPPRTRTRRKSGSASKWNGNAVAVVRTMQWNDARTVLDGGVIRAAPGPLGADDEDQLLRPGPLRGAPRGSIIGPGFRPEPILLACVPRPDSADIPGSRGRRRLRGRGRMEIPSPAVGRRRKGP